jgi:hypothetical protein
MTGYSREYKRKYGLYREDYDKLVTTQDGKCAICLEPKKLVVDHDHEDGKVRGLLCFKCNMLLGACSDSVMVLKRAIVYLSRIKLHAHKKRSTE